MLEGNSPQGNQRIDSSQRRRFLKGIATTGAVGLAGCSGNQDTQQGGGTTDQNKQGSAKPKRVKFNFLASASDPKTKELYKKTFEGYNEERSDLNIQYSGEFLSMDAFLQKMNTYLGAGNPPDLAYGGGNLTTFSNQLMDLKSIMEQNNVPKSLQMTFPGVGAPIHPVALEPNSRWHRSDVWEKANIGFDEMKEPKTWSTHRDHMQAVKDTLSGNKYPSFYLASDSVGAMLHNWHQYEVMSGVNYVRRTGEKLDDVEVSLGDERAGAIQYLKYGKEMYDNFSPDTTGYGWNELVQLYVNQTVQESMYPGRLLNNVIDQAPDLEKVTKPGYIEIPEENPAPSNHLVNSGKLSADDYTAQVSVNGFAVPKQADNRDISVDFLKWFFQTDYYTNAILAVPPHTIPANLKLLDSDAFKQNEIWGRHQEYKDFIKEYIPKCYPKVMGRTDPPSPYWNAITYASGIVPTMQQQVLLGQKSPEEAVDEAIPKLEQTTKETVSQYTG